ncbi:MAG TPA: transaldolase family protein [Patescibacteria group bacterium]|nr:transaldolase family protein [Patescibacteria group bacterium]
MTHFLLDSGDPKEYREIATLTKQDGDELWGSTTNPTLIEETEEQLIHHKETPQEAFRLQKELVTEILAIVPGAVSAEVYADNHTSAEQMAEQGREIASWHERIVVKLPTTLEGLKARTLLRKDGITINNTLVFSQEQVFAITLHEQLMKKIYGETNNHVPCFISPFVGRLDDTGINGMSLVSNALSITHQWFEKDLVWILEASVRNVSHLKAGIDMGCELITAPAKIYREWFRLSEKEKLTIYVEAPAILQTISLWVPSDTLRNIATPEELIGAIESGKLNINHQLTDTGIEKFAADWKKLFT